MRQSIWLAALGITFVVILAVATGLPGGCLPGSVTVGDTVDTSHGAVAAVTSVESPAVSYPNYPSPPQGTFMDPIVHENAVAYCNGTTLMLVYDTASRKIIYDARATPTPVPGPAASPLPTPDASLMMEAAPAPEPGLPPIEGNAPEPASQPSPSPAPAAVKENLVVPVEWGAWAAGLLLLAIPYAGIYVMYNRWK